MKETNSRLLSLDVLRGFDMSFIMGGEVVLNKAQTAALASSIQSEGSDRGGAPSFITGEQIYVVLNRFLSRIGEGEICTWKQ